MLLVEFDKNIYFAQKSVLLTRTRYIFIAALSCSFYEVKKISKYLGQYF